MAAVKGSKEHHWKVVRYHPSRRLAMFFFLFVVFVVGGQLLYWFGHKQGVSGQEQALTDLSAMQQKLALSLKAENQMAQELENIKLGGEVDQKSLEEVRLKVLELTSNIAALEEDNQFYRNLMAPAGNKRGLNFGAVEIVSTEAPKTYRFKVVLQQLATNHELLKGSLNFNIVGRENGEIKVLSLSDLSKDIDSSNIKLRFKYFQNIEGLLVLPEGFDPERIELDARSTGKNATAIEKRFGWLVEER